MPDPTTDNPSQPPRRNSRELQVVDGGAGPGPEPKKKKQSIWSKTSFVAGLLGAVFGLVGSLVGVGAVWGGSQASASSTVEKVKALEVAVESKADKAEAMKREERLRQQELASAELKAANTAEHTAINQGLAEMKKETSDVKKKVEDMERNLDAKLDKVLAKLK